VKPCWAAVHDQLPVGFGPVHLLGERGHIGRRDVRVGRAVAGQDLGRHGAGPRGRAGGQAAVDAHHAGQVRAGPGQGQHGHPAEAEPDGGRGPGRLRTAGQGGQAGLAAADEQTRVVAQGEQARHHPLPVPRDTVAEHVAGQHGIAEGGIAARLLPRVRVEAGPAVHEQDSGPRPFPGVIPAEHAGQRDVEVTVGKITGGDIHAPEITIQYLAQ